MKVDQIKFLAPGIGWGLLIGWLSLANLQDTGIDINISDKLAHFICYAVFVLLLLWGYYKSYKKVKIRNYIWLGFICILFGILMEYLQYMLTEHRQFDYADMLANTLGVIVGTILFYSLIITKHG